VPVHYREVQRDREPNWKLRATREERESERSQISQKDMVGEAPGPSEEESKYRLKVACFQVGHSRPCTNQRDSAEKREEMGPAD